jgi:hypothetical protein
VSVGYVGAVAADPCILEKERLRDRCRERTPPHHTTGTTVVMASGLAAALVGAALHAGARRPLHQGRPRPWPIRQRTGK